MKSSHFAKLKFERKLNDKLNSFLFPSIHKKHMHCVVGWLESEYNLSHKNKNIKNAINF